MTTADNIMLGLIYLLAINLLSMFMFVYDKSAAQKGPRHTRISEQTLLGLAMMGGTIGSITAQHMIRHKTRKQPFKSQLYTIAVLQTIILIALCIPEVRGFIITEIGRLSS